MPQIFTDIMVILVMTLQIQLDGTKYGLLDWELSMEQITQFHSSCQPHLVVLLVSLLILVHVK